MTRKALVAAEEKYRIALYRALETLINDATQQAKKGKPALLRVLTRAAGRGPKPMRTEERPDANDVERFNWSNFPKPERKKPS